MRAISVEEFDARFDELMELVEVGESFAITREGEAVAILQSVEHPTEGKASSDA